MADNPAIHYPRSVADVPGLSGAIATGGVLHLRLADSDAVFVCAEGVRVSYHRTVLEPCDDAPYGVETVTVTSPAGWLDYVERDGVHHLSIGEEPVAVWDAPTSEQSFGVTSALMGGGLVG